MPAALFLICNPKTDTNNAFSSSRIQYFEKIVSKTYRVHIEVVEQKGNPDRYLAIAREKTGRKFDRYFKFGHGEKKGQELAEGETHTSKDIDPAIYRDNMTPSGCVYYIGCELKWLAQETAKIARIRTFGFGHPGVIRTEILMNLKGTFRIIQSDGKQYLPHDEFNPDGREQRQPFTVDQLLPKIRELAEENESHAQYFLARNSIDPQISQKWDLRAAHNGHPDSRLFVLRNNLVKLDSEIRDRWIEELTEQIGKVKAIENGNFFAQKGELDIAEKLYRKAYMARDVRGAVGLAQVYQRQGNLKRALKGYGIAAGIIDLDASTKALNEIYGTNIPDVIETKDLIAVYKKMGIFEKVVDWTQKQASNHDLTAQKWLAEICEIQRPLAN